METKEFKFKSDSGEGYLTVGFFCEALCGQAQSKATIQICHGMAEYFERFSEFSEYLTRNGYNVCGIDMQGHGKTCILNAPIGGKTGYFGGAFDAADSIIADEITCKNYVYKNFSQKPFILYGHSMGSFVARAIFSRVELACEYDGFIISATSGPNPLAGFAKALAKTVCFFGKGMKPSNLINKLAFGNYCKLIACPQTPFDWLSSDEGEVSRYMSDPLAGFTFTGKGFLDMFTIIEEIQSKSAFKHFSKTPCFLPYGADDPVGNYGEGVEKLGDIMRRYGLNPIMKKYPSCRHEIHHEYCREEYFADVKGFIEMCLLKKEQVKKSID